jgi:phage-related holin
MENGMPGRLQVGSGGDWVTYIAGWLLGTVLGGIVQWWVASGSFFQYLVIALGILFVMDTVLGLFGSLVLRGEKFSSRKMKRTYTKLAQYLILILLAYLIDGVYTQATGATGHVYMLEIGAVLSILMHEGASVLEHLKGMEEYTGFRIPDWIGDKLSSLTEFFPREIQVREEDTQDMDEKQEPKNGK